MERRYESMMIIQNELSDEDLQNVFNKITKRIHDLGGKVIEEKIWAKEREFAYPIRSRGAGRKVFNRGCYWLVLFDLDTGKLPELKETIRLEEKILRNLIIRRSKI